MLFIVNSKLITGFRQININLVISEQFQFGALTSGFLPIKNIIVSLSFQPLSVSHILSLSETVSSDMA